MMNYNIFLKYNKMLRLFRPRRLIAKTVRGEHFKTNIIGKQLKGESKLYSLGKVAGYEKMILSKLSYFGICGNVFTIYCMLKAVGWALTIKDRRQIKHYEDKIVADALGVKELHENSKYAEYLDMYTQELFVSLPIILVLGAYTNKRFGSVYSFNLLLCSYGLGFAMRYTGLRLGKDLDCPPITVASALVAHTVFRSFLPFYGALGCSALMVPFAGIAGPMVGAMFALALP